MYIETEEHTEPTTWSDEEILKRSVDEPDFFVFIVRRYEAPFARKARKVLYNNEDIEDVVQETFTKIYLNAERFHKVEGASFKSWGYTILMNTAFTRYRKMRRTMERTAELTPEHYESLPDTGHEESFGLEASDYVVSLLAKMPEHLARVLDMHFLKEMPQQAIADAEGVSVGAIKTRVHRAKAQFRALADQYSPF
jgi:RNA polymerase sigma-70 factor (ECF subfamily)